MSHGIIRHLLDDNRTGDDFDDIVAYYGTPTLNPLWNKQFESKDESRDFELREALKVEYVPIDNLRLSLDFTLTWKDGTVEVFKSAQHNDFYQESDPAKKGSYDWT